MRYEARTDYRVIKLTRKDLRRARHIKARNRKVNRHCWYTWATMELGYSHLKAFIYAFKMRNEPVFDI